MKLYDIAPKTFAFNASDSSGSPTTVSVFASDRTVIDIQNVRNYYLGLGERRWDTSDVPNSVPPWPQAWFEFRELSSSSRRATSAILTDTRLTEYGFRTSAFAVIHSKSTGFMPLFGIGWDSGPEGAVLGVSQLVVDPKLRARTDVDSIAPGTFKNDAIQQVMVVMLAISFSHAKNVSLQDVSPSPKVAAKRRKAGKPVGVTYKTLVIDGMKEVLRTEGGIAGNGLKKALHICRGHFATYTDEKPLFGKVTGTFWKPMHTRGSKSRGEVKKDYKVTAGG